MVFDSDLVGESIDLFLLLRKTTLMSESCCKNWIAYEPFHKRFLDESKNGKVSIESVLDMMKDCCDKFFEDKEFRHSVPSSNNMIRGFMKLKFSIENREEWITFNDRHGICETFSDAVQRGDVDPKG